MSKVLKGRLRSFLVAAVIGMSVLIVYRMINTRPRVVSPSEDATENLSTEPVQGSLAPEFVLQSTDGESHSLIQLRGRPVVINFWATWCGPCRIEMPALQSRYEMYQEQGLVILAVNFDEAEDIVQAYGTELGLTFPLLVDPRAEVQHLYRIRSYPTSFFVDGDGLIMSQQIGVMTEGQLDEHLRLLDLSG